MVLQTVLLDRPAVLRPLYWRSLGGRPAAANRLRLNDAGELVIPAGATASFNTYFNAFFEYQWRLYTSLVTVGLRLQVDGDAWLRVWRRTPHGGSTLLHEQPASGAVNLPLALGAQHFRQGGLLWFDLAAQGRPVTLAYAQWVTSDSPAAEVGLGVVICTFNREAELSAVLARMAGHAALRPVISRVIVVNQGRPDLASHPEFAEAACRLGPRLRVVEQGNLGGAGGFGRGLVEAVDDPAISHVCLLDDDVVLEPDSLLRMGTFFSFARGELAVGGHMLDAVQPTTLYEAGAVVLENGGFKPLNAGLDLRTADALDQLLDSTAMHYNGWWMFGFPKRLIEALGMPLPCFIRGDDIEFGMRLHNRGVFTVPLPGIGIWHEPFYLKIGGWQLYYETRNALICAALHSDFAPPRIAVLMLKQLLIRLLTFRYYNAALVVLALDHFMQGPSILDRDPRPLHAALSDIRDRYPQVWTRRETVLPAASVGPSPRSMAGFLFAMLRALAGNWRRLTRPEATPHRLDVRDLVWFRVMTADNLAVETHWDAELPTFHRDRDRFRALLKAGFGGSWRL